MSGPHDDSLDRAFWEMLDSMDEEPAALDLVANAQRLALQNEVDCAFDQASSIEDAIEACNPNTEAVLKMALGMDGEITWVTCNMPWNSPDTMANRIAQQMLWIPSKPDSYSGEVVSVSQFNISTSCEARFLECNLEKLLDSLTDPACPIVLRVVLRGLSPRDEACIRDMHEKLSHHLYKVIPLVHGMSIPSSIIIKGRSLEFYLPVRDYPKHEKDDTPVDSLSELIDFLGSLGKGRRGNDRFTCVAHLLAPQPNVFDRKGERALLYKHRCTLVSQSEPPTVQQIASFFEITSEQVEDAIREFFS